MRVVLLLFAAVLMAAPDDVPRYTSDGKMLRPDNYREWVFLSSGLGMTYGPLARQGEPSFDNVFVNREAYRSFMQTGTWPNGTMLALEVRGSESKGSINQGGHYQGAGLRGLEVHVKDDKRFPRKWAFFGFGEGETASEAMPPSHGCFGCHEPNGAVDTTFVQFYPTLIKVAKEKGTYKEK